MPRHPRIALTSRLRVHTTNDNTGSVFRLTRNSAEQCRVVVFGVVENRSAFVVMNASSHWSRQPCGQRFLSEPTPHGIDLKKPFTMSNIGKRALTASLLVSTTRISFSSSSKIAVVCVPACARQSQQSCALWARFAALAVLGAMHRSFATSSSLLRTGGAYRDRTDDLMLAKQPLSQLS